MEGIMERSTMFLVKQEFDKSVSYLDSRKDQLTTGECLQELGHLRLFIYNLWINKRGVAI